MKSYKLYLFDLDGTLIDSDQMIIETFRELYPLYRPGFNPSDDYIRQFSGPQMADTLKKEFPNFDQTMILDEYKKRSQKYYDKSVQLFPNVKEMLELLNEKNIKFGVITNKFRFATDYTYKLLGIDKLNIFSVCADDVKNYKPSADGIIEAMHHFGIKNKEDVIYIGDCYIDYVTAQNAGVNFGYISWSPRPINKDLKVDAKITNYKDFAEEIVG